MNEHDNWVLKNPPPDTGEMVTDGDGNLLRKPPEPPEVFELGDCSIPSAELYSGTPHLRRFISQTHSAIEMIYPGTREAIDDYFSTGRIWGRIHDLDPELRRLQMEARKADPDRATANRGTDALRENTPEFMARDRAFRDAHSDRIARARQMSIAYLRRDLQTLLDRYGTCAPQAYALLGGNRHTYQDLVGLRDHLGTI